MRPLRRKPLALVVAVIAVAAGATVALTTSTTPPVSTTLPVAQFNRIVLSYTSTLSTTAEANRYQFMIMQATDASEIKVLKAANPNLKVLLYQDPFLARPTDPTGLTVCSTWPTLSHGWMIKDRAGGIVQDVEEPGNYLMNLSNTDYQHSCVIHAITLAKQLGADGILFDDINAALGWYLPAAVTVPKFPTSASWENGETSFLEYAAEQVHAAGLLVFANLGGASTVPGLWEQWSGILDGSQEQSWNDWAAGTADSLAEWQQLLQEPIWSEAHKKYTLLESDDNGERQNTFGLASMMLVADGKTSYSTANLNQTADEQWYPTYSAAQQLGDPAGKYAELPDGIYLRLFTNGLVIVNPTDTARSFTLSRALVNSATGRRVTSLSVAAESGYILVRPTS